MTDLIKQLRVLSGMTAMGEPIKFGSDSRAMSEAADRIEQLEAALKHYSCDCTASAQCPPCMLQDGDCGYVARKAL